MGEISFASAGGDTKGVLIEPAGDGKAPGVILVQEYWGLNAHVRDLAARLAKEGFLVLAPDLYDGVVAKNAEEAGALMQKMDTLVAVKRIAGAARVLREHPRGNGKVGITGFCMGGAITFAAACHVEGLSAAVPFYGIPPAEKVDYAKVTAPIQAHFAKDDQWATVAKAEAIKKQLEARGQTMELCVYDAGHAFMNDTRPEAHNPAAAKEAWTRMVAFLHRHVG